MLRSIFAPSSPTSDGPGCCCTRNDTDDRVKRRQRMKRGADVTRDEDVTVMSLSGQEQVMHIHAPLVNLGGTLHDVG